jgi:hypothetical protein
MNFLKIIVDQQIIITAPCTGTGGYNEFYSWL